jgi:hypothetical protein
LPRVLIFLQHWSPAHLLARLPRARVNSSCARGTDAPSLVSGFSPQKHVAGLLVGFLVFSRRAVLERFVGARVRSPEALPNRAAAFVSLGLAPSRIARRQPNFRFPSPARTLPAALLIFLAPPPSGLVFPQPVLGFRAAFVPCSSTRTWCQ